MIRVEGHPLDKLSLLSQPYVYRVLFDVMRHNFQKGRMLVLHYLQLANESVLARHLLFGLLDGGLKYVRRQLRIFYTSVDQDYVPLQIF